MELSREKQIELYRTMVKIRKFEQTAMQHFLRGEVPGFLHLYVGEEAIATGVCANLTDRDQICSTHRGHGHCIAKGGDVQLMMAELWGKSTGYCYGKGGSMHIADRDIGILGANGIVGAGSPIAVGAAFAQKYLKTNDVTVVFFGDGASNRGTQHEAMNMASNWNLPVVFVNENNGYGLYTPQKVHQNITDISVRAAAYGMRGVTCDGNDVMEVYNITHEAVEQCRRGEGPVLLEFKTWRHLGHFIGDEGTYKDAKEQQYWIAEKDPIKNYAISLIAQGVANEKELADIEAQLQHQMEEAVCFAENSPAPKLEEMTVGTYCEV